MPISELAAFARSIGASFHLSWSANGYRAAFVNYDGTGEIATSTHADADAAVHFAMRLVKIYTRPDGGIDWAPIRKETP